MTSARGGEGSPKGGGVEEEEPGEGGGGHGRRRKAKRRKWGRREAAAPGRWWGRGRMEGREGATYTMISLCIFMYDYIQACASHKKTSIEIHLPCLAKIYTLHIII